MGTLPLFYIPVTFYVIAHICLPFSPLSCPLPPALTVSCFLFLNDLSSLSMVRVFSLPTTEATEVPSRNYLFPRSQRWARDLRPANQTLSPRTLHCGRDSEMVQGPRSLRGVLREVLPRS